MKLSRLPRFGARTGMTLVEILAVVVILGLLATTLTVGFSGSFGKAKSELARTGVGQVTQKLELYKIEKDAWPSLDVGLRALSEGFATPNDSFYLEPDQLLDPWGKPYYFVTPGPDQRPYEVVSYGADAQPGGEGENADISSARLRAKQ
ncbi:MAG TPA: type II secretion system major pseudopilin GspG [Planctomycetota bacterium]|nr:type II secretion system major pseudopilin GspG [Planctomycetota bacterium]